MLKALQAEIDQVDEKILTLLAKRGHILDSLQAHKEEKGLGRISEAEIEKLIKKRIKLGKKHDLDQNIVRAIFSAIMK